MDLTFSVLGAVRAQRDGRDLALGSPQQRALLAVLLLREGRATPLDELVEALWTDPPARAVGTVRTYASRLRAALDPDRSLLVSEGSGYALTVPPHSVDVVRAERLLAEAADLPPPAARPLLEEASALWQGTPLAGVPGPFAARHRARLAELLLTIRQSALELDLALGRPGDAAGELAVLVSRHPYREPLRALLMLALYRSGRQADALAAFTAGAALLAADLGTTPGQDLRELHTRILRADPALRTPQPPPRPAPDGGGERVPAQLPADLPDFSGRVGVIRRIERALTAPDGAVVAISGPGGVGKTVLAVHAAHLVRDEFPDGQLYADLRGAGPRPADPADVQADLLRALGVTGPYRAALADRRLLLLLDNARDLAQLAPLLPGPPSTVIVTSRTRLPLVRTPAPVAVDLEAFSELEAIDLFTAIVGQRRTRAERHATLEVIGLCSRLPLAVRIAASRLAARPNWTIASLAARLADGR
ncbi:AfsR/SARP family transcriptional regulator, partial [Actinocorallia lasiicapitis]